MEEGNKQLFNIDQFKNQLLQKIAFSNQDSINRIYGFVMKTKNYLEQQKHKQSESDNQSSQSSQSSEEQSQQSKNNQSKASKIKAAKKKGNQTKNLFSYFISKKKEEVKGDESKSLIVNGSKQKQIKELLNQSFSNVTIPHQTILKQIIKQRKVKNNKKSRKIIHIQQNLYGFDFDCLVLPHILETLEQIPLNPFSKCPQIQYQMNSQDQLLQFKNRFNNAEGSQSQQSELQQQSNEFLAGDNNFDHLQKQEDTGANKIYGQYILKWNKWQYNYHIPNNQIQSKYKIIAPFGLRLQQHIQQNKTSKRKTDLNTNNDNNLDGDVKKKKTTYNNYYDLIKKFPNKQLQIIQILKVARTKKQIVENLTQRYMISKSNITRFISNFCIKNEKSIGFSYIGENKVNKKEQQNSTKKKTNQSENSETSDSSYYQQSSTSSQDKSNTKNSSSNSSSNSSYNSVSSNSQSSSNKSQQNTKSASQTKQKPRNTKQKKKSNKPTRPKSNKSCKNKSKNKPKK